MIITDYKLKSTTEYEYKLGRFKKGIYIAGFENKKAQKNNNGFYGDLAIIADHCNPYYLSVKEFEQLANFLGFYKKEI